MRSNLLLASVALLGVGLMSCRQDMHDPPRYRPLAKSTFFPDGRASRPIIEGTVAWGKLKTDTRMFKGKVGNDFISDIPVPVTEALLTRGQQRFNIYCSPCHGGGGDGEGMVVQRGFKHPPSYHSDKLRNQPSGYYFDVISNGFGAMASYASRVPVADRWAIIAYIRALQYSRLATIDDVPESLRSQLDSGKAVPAPGAAQAANSQEAHH
ncbi:MAG: cytochrome c [Bryobacteraceae bacterium]